MVAALFLCLLTACAADVRPQQTVPILLAESEGMTVSGDSRVMAAPGERVAFAVTIAEGYLLDGVDGGSYIDGQIVLDAARYPTTIVPHTRRAEPLFFDLNNDLSDGGLTYSHSGGMYPEGTSITVTAEPKEGKHFLGYTLDRPLRSGGELVCREQTYSFTLSQKTDLYTNYAAEDSDLLIYHAGGGKFRDTAGDVLTVEIADSYYLCPNTMLADGSLSRNGYTLIGYSTDENYRLGDDRAGLLTPGANVVMPEERIVHLYPVWVEWTPAEQFTYTLIDGDVAITGYTGTGETLAIPATIDHKPVTRIEKNAISGSFTTLVLHPGIERIAPNAIVKCPQMTTLFFYDTVKAVNDNAFANCPEFSTLHVCAAQPPRYTDHRHGTYAKKFERLITAQGKKLIVASGSSTVYGLDSATLEKALGGEYAVVNYGTHWASSVCFYLEMISAFVGEGDLVIHAPETRESQFGGNVFEFNIWQMQEAVPEVFSYVDIRNYSQVFSSFASYNTTRSKLKPLTYEHYSKVVNDYGDFFKQKDAQGINYVKSPGSVNFELSNLKAANIERLNRVAATIREKGGEMLFSFAPMNRNALKGASLRASTRSEFVARLDSMIDYPRITDAERMLLPGNWFFDSDYHLCSERAITRAEMLGEDVAAYLKSTHGGKQ